jgi:hypothetical protein
MLQLRLPVRRDHSAHIISEHMQLMSTTPRKEDLRTEGCDLENYYTSIY